MVITRVECLVVTVLALGFGADASAAPALPAGARVEVVSEDVAVKSGRDTVFVADVSERFDVLRSHESWVRIARGGREGWISRADVVQVRSTRRVSAQEVERELAGRAHPLARFGFADDRTRAIESITRTIAVLREGLRAEEAGRVPRPGRMAKLRAALLEDANFVADWRRDEDPDPAAELPLRRLILHLEKQRSGRDHWRTTDARIALGTAERVASLGSDNRQRLIAARLRGNASLYPDDDGIEEALRTAEEVASVYAELLGEDHPHYAASLNNIAMLHLQQREYARARPLFEQSLRAAMEAYGHEHPITVTARTNVATLVQALGDRDGARKLLESALEDAERIEDHDGPVGQLLVLLAALHLEDGAHEDSLAYYIRAAQHVRRTMGENAAELGIILDGSGIVRANLGQLEAARSDFERAREIIRERYGETHLHHAVVLNNIATLETIEGNHDSARRTLRTALDIRGEIQGTSHPDYLLQLQNLGVLDALTGHPREAAEAFDRQRRETRRHVTRVLPGLTGDEQLRFLRVTDLLSFEASLSLGLDNPDDESIAEKSAGWLVNGKSLTDEALAGSLLAARGANDPRSRTLLQELDEARTEFARATLDGMAGGQSLADLENRVDGLVKQLGTQGLDNLELPEWSELATVRANIPEGAVLIEFARFRRADLRELAWKPAHYAAWIVPPAGTGRVEVVDLGSAERIDEVIGRVRTSIEETPKRTKSEDPAALEAEARTLLVELGNLILAPIRDRLGKNVDRLILGPDGALWLVPWSALVLPDERYAVEQYEVGYVVSGRDLLGNTPYAGSSEPPVILADPDFDRVPERLAAIPAPRGGPGVIPRVARLPSTRAEADAIRPGLRELTDHDPRVYLDSEASEEVFGTIAHPTVLAIATHGFFLRDQSSEPSGERLLSFDTAQRSVPRLGGRSSITNPLLRCGLLLAGANERDRAAADVDDGVLTGAEIVGADLRGTKLVVLSACETGIGEVRNGEGVAGLRQAFQLAGAESVVASLWQVDDLATARLMRDFFAHLATPGTRRTAALREAQLARIASRRDRDGAAHPFYWAAFTLTGDSGEPPGITKEK